MKRLVRFVGIAGMLALLSGCVMKQLQHDLNEFERVNVVSGRVVSGSGLDKPIVVVLWSVDHHLDSFNNYWVIPPDGYFKFGYASGRYYLFAYEDANEDGDFQAGVEYGGIYGDAAVLDLGSRKNYQNLLLKLSPPGELTIPAEIELASDQEVRERFEWRKGMTSVVTTINDPVFCAENADFGFWSPYAFFKQYGLKIYQLETYDPQKTPVIFVHGANGHPGNFKMLIDQMDREHFQPWVTFYPSGARLENLGNVLASMIREMRILYSYDEVVVVAHSMGGLLSRYEILNYAEEESRSLVPRYITFATPWNGHEAVSMGVKHAPAVIPSWYDMLPGNPFIKRLFEQQLPAETEHYLFFAHEGSGGSPFSSDNTDGTVSLKSQLYMPAQDQATRLIGIPSTHVGILSHPVTIEKFNQILDEYRESK